MREFIEILQTHRYYKEEQHAKSEQTYHFKNGSFIEFFGADDMRKVMGPRRDILFVNEANNVPYQTFRQLDLRTRGTVFLDYNPVSEFWVHDDLIPHTKHDFVILTYKDNEALDKNTVRKIEELKRNKNLWKVYGLGEIGVKEGQIYPEWTQIDEVPGEARRERRWLDFGYTNHPTAIGSRFTLDGEPIYDEEEYRVGMTNREIADKIKTLPEPRTLVIADSAEPKSIDELKSYGINIAPAVKGPGSVNFGIDTVMGMTPKVTKRSTNIIKENRNYLWKTDKDGNPLNEPEKVFDHHMDGIRYVESDLAESQQTPELVVGYAG